MAPGLVKVYAFVAMSLFSTTPRCLCLEALPPAQNMLSLSTDVPEEAAPDMGQSKPVCLKTNLVEDAGVNSAFNGIMVQRSVVAAVEGDCPEASKCIADVAGTDTTIGQTCNLKPIPCGAAVKLYLENHVVVNKSDVRKPCTEKDCTACVTKCQEHADDLRGVFDFITRALCDEKELDMDAVKKSAPTTLCQGQPDACKKRIEAFSWPPNAQFESPAVCVVSWKKIAAEIKTLVGDQNCETDQSCVTECRNDRGKCDAITLDFQDQIKKRDEQCKTKGFEARCKHEIMDPPNVADDYCTQILRNCEARNRNLEDLVKMLDSGSNAVLWVLLILLVVTLVGLGIFLVLYRSSLFAGGQAE